MAVHGAPGKKQLERQAGDRSVAVLASADSDGGIVVRAPRRGGGVSVLSSSWLLKHESADRVDLIHERNRRQSMPYFRTL